MSVITTPTDPRLEEQPAFPPDKGSLWVGSRTCNRSSAGAETLAFVTAGVPVHAAARACSACATTATATADAGAVHLPQIRAREEETKKGSRDVVVIRDFYVLTESTSSDMEDGAPSSTTRR